MSGFRAALWMERGVATVRLAGEVDYRALGEVHQIFADAVAVAAAARPTVVIVAMADVTFMDASGLGALIRMRMRLREQGGRLVLRERNPHVERVARVAGVRNVLLRLMWTGEDR